jgi:glycosyltransferase involved in cell wall biosynthesis
MKVLILNYEYPPMGGGAGRCTRHLAQTLTLHGVTVDVLTSRYGKTEEEKEVPGLRVFRLPIWRRGILESGFRGALSYLFLGAFKIRSVVRENGYDLIHYFFSLPTGLLSYALRGFDDIPSVVSLRGSDVPHYDPYNRTLEMVHRMLLPVNMSIWRRSARVVANSTGLGNLALRQMPGLDIEVIPNAIDPELFKPPEQRKSADGKVRLLTVSRMIRRKGMHHLIESLADLKDAPVELTLVGTGSSEEELRNLIHRTGLREKTRLLGYLPQEALPEQYSQADIFVLPSLAESGGEAFLEAMACGLPIVGTTAGGIPEYVVHGEGGLLVAPGDVPGLRGAIATLAGDAEMRARMGSFNRRRVLENYTWEKATLQYLEIYRQAVSG